jgi:DUF971 family protein
MDKQRKMEATPKDIQMVNNELCIVWNDGEESYFPAEQLRAASPSAANIGERDILGNQYGGDGPKKFPGVTIEGWDFQGNYAIRPWFSDGHQTGLYSWAFLRALDAQLKNRQEEA